ncbi:MAG TPA: ABC transporter ATP-binding protein [Spirillospora sp.]|nr:ABC transporter ATP-binding protein [Spirillospora sp.]
MANVRINELVKRFDQVFAVDHVSVEIPEGSLTAILGPSGCGKTTLLRCIAGLAMPDSGQIFIGEKDVTRLEPFKRNLGMVFQRPSMFPHMTAFENIAWGLRLRNWPKRDVAPRVHEMLQLVHLDGMENRTARQLSGGQAQRVVIARALAPEPDLLLLDEPLSALDAKLRDELILEIAEIHRKTGCTTILVTHDQGEAFTIADNVLLMNAGRIEQQGAPIDIYQNPRTLFSATFIGTNNFLPGVVLEGGSEVVVRIEALDIIFRTQSSWKEFEPGDLVWVCMRADDIDIISEDRASSYRNTIQVGVDHASLTGGIVIIEGRLADQPLRIHVGGSQRFNLLDSAGKTIVCGLSHIALIPREDGRQASNNGAVSSLLTTTPLERH